MMEGYQIHGKRQREKGLAVPGFSGRTGEAQIKSAIGISITNSLPENPWMPETSRIPKANRSPGLLPLDMGFLGEEQWAPALFHSHFQEPAREARRDFWLPQRGCSMVRHGFGERNPCQGLTWDIKFQSLILGAPHSSPRLEQDLG